MFRPCTGIFLFAVERNLEVSQNYCCLGVGSMLSSTISEHYEYVQTHVALREETPSCVPASRHPL